jgi:two-component system, NtrC family, sensor histidine kinase HydH
LLAFGDATRAFKSIADGSKSSQDVEFMGAIPIRRRRRGHTVMSYTTPGNADMGHEGSSFARVLRDFPVRGIVIFDAAGKVNALTPGAAQLFAASPTADSPNADALPAPLPAIVREMVASGGTNTAQPVRFESCEFAAGELQLSASFLPLAGANAGLAMVLHDRAPLRALEQNLSRLDQLAGIGTLAAGMAHEVKNALVAVTTFINLLLEKNPDSELADVVRREMGRIDSIVSQVLRCAAPPCAQQSTVRLHDVLEHALRLIQPQLERNSIALERSFQAAPDTIHGDDYQLEQAFVNLLLNALEAMNAGGTLFVATRVVPAGGTSDPHTRPHLRITVRDTGHGISSENMARMFEPFFTTKPKGTGLGLSIARRIIEEHCGAITIESQSGQGATFCIDLPAPAGDL